MLNESFCAFCNRAEACHFCEWTKVCRAEELAIRDQIAIGTTNDTIREKVMLQDWNLIDFCTSGMKYESVGGEKISGVYINKLGAYSYCKLTNKKSSQPRKPGNPEKKMLSMWYEIDSWTHKTMQSYQCKMFKLQEERTFF